MRCLLLAVVAGLAVLAVGIHAEDVAVDESVEEVVEIDLDKEAMTRMLGDLFDDEDFEEAVEEQESNREARARGAKADESPAEEEKAVVDAKDQARYNSFIDTFFRRLNSFARSRFDPLSVGLDSDPKKGKSGNSKKGKSGKAQKSDKKKGKGGNSKKGKKGGNTKKSSKKGNKSANKKGKKGNRHPKDLDLGEVAEEVPIVEEEEEVEDVHDINKREAEVIDLVEIDEEEEGETDLEEEDDDEEESLVRVARNADEESDDTAMEETSRRGRPAKGGKKGSTKKGKKNKGGNKQRKGKKKSGKKDGKKGNSGKKSGKKGNKSKRSAKDSKARTSRASVTGIATVRRTGDVKVTNKKGGKEMRAAFTLGPVDLKVNRKFGKGKDAVTKEARAVSPELTGKLSIQVASNGKARMTNFRINRPAIVQVEGSLRKTEKGGKSDNNFMERSIGRFSPIASKKLKAASREILSAGEPKAQGQE